MFRLRPSTDCRDGRRRGEKRKKLSTQLTTRIIKREGPKRAKTTSDADSFNRVPVMTH
jgi:hypothetical protein